MKISLAENKFPIGSVVVFAGNNSTILNEKNM